MSVKISLAGSLAITTAVAAPGRPGATGTGIEGDQILEGEKTFADKATFLGDVELSSVTTAGTVTSFKQGDIEYLRVTKLGQTQVNLNLSNVQITGTNQSAIVWGSQIISRTRDGNFNAGFIADNEKSSLVALAGWNYTTSIPGGFLILESTLSTPTEAGQILGSLLGRGKWNIDTGDNPTPAYMMFVSGGPWAQNNCPMDVVFGASPAGTQLATEKFRVTGIGAKVTGKLEVTTEVVAPNVLTDKSIQAASSPGLFKNGSWKRVRARNVPAGTNTFYTVPAGKKAIIAAYAFVNPTGAAITIALAHVLGGVTHQIQPAVNVNPNANSGANALFYVLEAGESFAGITNGAGLNLNVRIIEFDASSGFKSPRLLTLSAGDNVLYTCPAGKRAITLTAGATTQGAVLPNAFIYNSSGGTRTYSVHGTDPGTTATSNDTRTGGLAILGTNSVNLSQYLPVTVEAGESIVINVDAAGASYVTALLYELDI